MTQIVPKMSKLFSKMFQTFQSAPKVSKDDSHVPKDVRNVSKDQRFGNVSKKFRTFAEMSHSFPKMLHTFPTMTQSITICLKRFKRCPRCFQKSGKRFQDVPYIYNWCLKCFQRCPIHLESCPKISRWFPNTTQMFFPKMSEMIWKIKFLHVTFPKISEMFQRCLKRFQRIRNFFRELQWVISNISNVDSNIYKDTGVCCWLFLIGIKHLLATYVYVILLWANAMFHMCFSTILMCFTVRLDNTCSWNCLLTVCQMRRKLTESQS